MVQPSRVQLSRLARVAMHTVLTGLLIVFFTVSFRPLLEPVGTDVAREEIQRSARLPVLLWCLGAPIALSAGSGAVRARFAWTLGCALLLVHMAVAFHLGHGWSHRAAWEHTRQVGGYGDGIFVNYGFALVWLADVLWACGAFDSYRARPRWLTWSVMGFLGFVVFNAAVVFGGWGARVAFGAGLLVAVAFAVNTFRARR